MRLSAPWVLGIILVGIGLTLFAYKAFYLGFPMTPNGKSESWYIEAKLEFEGRGKPAKVSLYIPQNSGPLALVDENFVSEGYGLARRTEASTGNRKVVWTKREAYGRQFFFYRTVLYQVQSSEGTEGAGESPVAESIVDTEEFQATAKNDPKALALQALVSELRKRSADEGSFITELFNALHSNNNEQIHMLRGHGEDLQSEAEIAAYVLNSTGIPARVVNGVRLSKQERVGKLVSWVDVWLDGSWRPVDMDNGVLESKNLMLPWWYGSKPLFSLTGGAHPKLDISVRHNTEDAIIAKVWQGDEAAKRAFNLSLLSLPVDSQLLFMVLLLVPLGALTNAFLRQFIGIKTFGTFMPVLVALAFRQTELLWGIILFTSIVAIGLLIRTYFERLKLLMVPRLTAVLTVVVLVITVLSLLMNHLGVTTGLSISLFPMVIITMTIERMNILWEEMGPKEAITTGIGSLFSAVCAYLVMYNPYCVHLIFTFPELLLILLAVAIAMGRYHGYKLTEYYRFRNFKNAPHAAL